MRNGIKVSFLFFLLFTSFLLFSESEKISLDLKGADLRDVLRMFSEQYNMNIIAGNEVQGEVTVSFHDVSPEKALRVILNINGFDYVEEGNIMRVIALKNTRVFHLRYVDASSVLPQVKELLSPAGNVSTFKRKGVENSNILIVKDSPVILDIVQKIIKKLDKNVPQVFIEARLMTVDISKIKQLGISWGYKKKKYQGGWGINQEDYVRLLLSGIPPGGTAPDRIPVIMEQGWIFGKWALAPGDYWMLIKTLETRLDANTLSQPHLVTEDNKEAEIFVGQEVPVPTYSFNRDTNTWEVTGTETVKEGVTLKVTPRINVIDKTVTMQISPEVSGPITYKQDPSTGRIIGVIKPSRTARTTVTIPSGKTMVIGGLISEALTMTKNKVPGLGDIPILGDLFSYKNPRRMKTDLLIFVTPHILSEQNTAKITSESQKYIKSQSVLFLDEALAEGKKYLNLGYLKEAQKKFKEALKYAPLEEKKGIEKLLDKVRKRMKEKQKSKLEPKKPKLKENKGYIFKKEVR